MRAALDIARTLSSDYYPLTPEELKSLASIISHKKVKKGEVLLEAGQIARHFLYLEKGMLRQFYYKNGRDITEHFTTEGHLTFCIISMFQSEPTELMIEALENGLVYTLPYDQMIELSNKFSGIAHLIRKILENALGISQVKADSWRFESVRERYERFIREYPEAAKRASVSHIASYLLMTQESLSRVRAGTL